MRVLILGCGYAGIPLGRLLVWQGHEVCGARRTAEADPELNEAGILPLRADITDPSSLERIEPAFDAVVNMVSSSKGRTEDYRRVYLGGNRNILNWLGSFPPGRAPQYIYTSSTSVYAQQDGSWVTEESPANPASETSQVLAQTEEILLAASFPATILRVSGIYGPERGHLFKQFLRNEAAMRDEGQSWINMLHVDDLAAAIAHLIQRRSGREVFNVTDDEPVTQFEFFRWLSEKLGKPMPPSSPPDPARKRGVTNKRVSNRKLKSTGFQFRYPTFREGYGAEMERLGLK